MPNLDQELDDILTVADARENAAPRLTREIQWGLRLTPPGEGGEPYFKWIYQSEQQARNGISSYRASYTPTVVSRIARFSEPKVHP